MTQQKMTAYYYRSAYKKDDLQTDNQMQLLIAHANMSGLSNYLLYVDNGYSANAENRPALAELQNAMAHGGIDSIVVSDVVRISRDPKIITAFLNEAAKYNITVMDIDGEILAPLYPLN